MSLRPTFTEKHKRKLFPRKGNVDLKMNIIITMNLTVVKQMNLKQ